MRKSIEIRYLKEIEDEKIFMCKYDDTIKSVKSYNKKVDDIIQDINKQGVILQEEVQKAKQTRMQLCNYLVEELMKPKTYYKRCHTYCRSHCSLFQGDQIPREFRLRVLPTRDLVRLLPF